MSERKYITRAESRQKALDIMRRAEQARADATRNDPDNLPEETIDEALVAIIDAWQKEGERLQGLLTAAEAALAACEAERDTAIQNNEIMTNSWRMLHDQWDTVRAAVERLASAWALEDRETIAEINAELFRWFPPAPLP